MIKSQCKYCKSEVVRNGYKPAIFCNRICKGEWQKTQKPVDKIWLEQKYLIEKLSTYEISTIVKRNPKQVWMWLKGYNIPTRTVVEELEKNAYRKKVSAGEAPAPMLGKHHSDVTKYLLSIQRQGIVPTHICGKNSYLYGKSGNLNPQWKGGITPEREKFYKTYEWKRVYKIVLKRDNFRCVNCNAPSTSVLIGKKKISNLCVHHITSFQNKDLRCNINNLILLCRKCHYWTHSCKNTTKKYLINKI